MLIKSNHDEGYQIPLNFWGNMLKVYLQMCLKRIMQDVRSKSVCINPKIMVLGMPFDEQMESSAKEE